MTSFRSRLATALAAGSLALALTAAPVLTTAAPASAQPAGPRDLSAAYGAGYLGRQILANGGYVTSFGTPDIPTTAYAVLGLAATGTGRSAAASAIAWLKTDLDAGLKGFDGRDDPGRVAQVVLAAVATGSQPRRFGGSAAENDLVSRLLATMRTAGADRGLFGTADPTYDGAFRQGLALAALKAVGVRSGLVAPALGWLQRQQCADGLWTSYRADLSVACPAADPSTFSGPDTNSTGMAVQGLAAYGSRPRTARLLASLDRIQTSDGGFPYLAAPDQSSEPSSTALSIQAILASGASVRSARFTVGGRTAYQALAGFQLGCGDAGNDRGAFFYPGSRTPNTYSTVQSVPAMAGRTLPIARSAMSDALPTVPCAKATRAVRDLTATAVTHTTTPATAAATAAAVRAGTPGSCSGLSGVTVAVDFTAFGRGVQVRCAPGDPATGIAALQQAGFAVTGTQRYGLAFVCRLNGLPTPAQDPCMTTPPASAYWSYYHAGRTATSWTYSSVGPTSYNPAPGTIEAWAFGGGAKPSRTPNQVRNTHG